ncbi:hypothetical protein SteCoe_19327 [Stentor coeruleus]|uniref:Uncharacterized protein n=1 Tax=Stentor coeruleus TaxID=5963 RepID=A0A1R2BUC7_9CILI|nr:hypothetical protein SteCoe_19327 [Stentor coeruleus]
MGCCVFLPSEIKATEFVNENKVLGDEGSSSKFNELSLSSESETPPLKEWLEYKKYKSLTESTDAFSSFYCSGNKKIGEFRTCNNQGSIVDSFYVALPNSFLQK